MDYLPDDARWAEHRLPNEFLRVQCRRRGLDDDGSRPALQKRLFEYKRANNPIAREGEWLMTPYLFVTQEIHWHWRCNKHFVSKVVDKSDSQGGLRKCFTIALGDENANYGKVSSRIGEVTFGRTPTCSCLGVSPWFTPFLTIWGQDTSCR